MSEVSTIPILICSHKVSVILLLILLSIFFADVIYAFLDFQLLKNNSIIYYRHWALLGCPAARPASVAAADETFVACHTLFSELAHLA